MIGKIKYLLILILAVIITDASAQSSQVLYYMNLPQNHLINPALRPSNSVYVGLPALSGTSLTINNNFVNFSDVFIKGQLKDSIISFLHPDYNVDKFLDKTNDKNSIEPQSMIQLLGIGFSSEKGDYFFLDINERVEANFVLPGGFLKLALKGNEEFVGSTIDLSSLRADMRYYREVGFGFSRNFTDKLRIGVKGKILFGIAAASIDNQSLGITVNDDYSHTLDADITVNMSGPVDVYMDSGHNIDSIVFDDSRFKTSSGRADFFSGIGNPGFGLDIGATYDLTEKIVVSAAITDLGFIRWKKDVTNVKVKNQFEFSGLNMLDVINGTITIDELGQDMLDSLKDSFIVTKSNEPFTTYLPFGISIGGSYNVTSQFSVGMLSYSRIIGKQIREALTFSANINIGNAFSTSFSYTAANHRYDNFGAGLAFRTGIVQFYLLSDRIPISWNKIKDTNSTIPLPANWNIVNLRIGMNLVFGNGPRGKDDKPMILVE